MSLCVRAVSSWKRRLCLKVSAQQCQPWSSPCRDRRNHPTTAVRTGTRTAVTNGAGRLCVSHYSPHRRMLSSSSVGTAATSETNSPAGSDVGSTTAPSHRNKKLAAVIREGIAYLNQSAAAIQNNVHTAKNIFASPEEQHGPDAKQLSEENRIFTTAQECLEDMCTRDPFFP